MVTKEFIERAIVIHKDKYDYSLVKYKNMHEKIKIICNVHGVFEQTPHNHLRHGCRKCFFENRKKTIENRILDRFRNVHNETYDYSMVKYESMHKKIKIICKEHGIFEQTPANHLSGKGCYKCANNFKKEYDDIIFKLNLLHSGKYQYHKDFNKTTDKIKIFCKDHGYFYQTLNNHLDGHGCPYCNESHGEKKISEFLNKKGIKYNRQKTFDGCKDIKLLPFDFYIENNNLCIEYDGEHHYNIIEEWGGYKNYLKIKEHDDIKNKYCKENNIELVRISYLENLEENLNSVFK